LIYVTPLYVVCYNVFVYIYRIISNILNRYIPVNDDSIDIVSNFSSLSFVWYMFPIVNILSSIVVQIDSISSDINNSIYIYNYYLI